MKRREQLESWDLLAEKLTEIYWRGSIGPAETILNRMLAALSECIHYRDMDRSLIQALYRVCDFFCFENRFADAEKLYEIVLNAQSKLEDSDEFTIETIARLERLRFFWDKSKTNTNTLINLWPVRNVTETLRKAS